MWVNAKPRMAILLKLATDSKKKVRKNGLAFLKRLLKDTNSNISNHLWSKGTRIIQVLYKFWNPKWERASVNLDLFLGIR